MKVLFFLLIVSVHILHSQPLNSDSAASVTSGISVKPLFNSDSLLVHAMQLMNKPYSFGGHLPETGFDCSGFVCYNFKRYSIELPHSSSEQMKYGENIKKTEALPGDLIFFKGSDVNSTDAGHVGIVVARNDTTIKFIHSAYKGGIRLDSTTAEYYRKRYLGVRRIVNNGN